MEGRVVDVEPVSQEPVLGELLAVLRGHDHDRVLQRPPAVELGEERFEPVVQVGDLAVVVVHVTGRLGVHLPHDLDGILRPSLDRGERRQGIVEGVVGVVVVQEGEEGAISSSST